LSRNEFFEISEVQIGHHFFKVFGKIGKMTLPKRRKYCKIFCEIIQIFWPFLVRFELNLGLNYLKFSQEAIFAVDLIRSSRSDRVDTIKNGFLAKF
jgi:hypothetical protein